MADPDFLERLHAGFAVPQQEVVAFVEGGSGSPVEAIERLTLGDENEVYRVVLAASELPVYVRIRRPGTGTFDAEVWAMAEARSAGVAVPDVLALTEFATADGARSAMLVAGAEGRPLAEVLPALTPEQRHVALTNLGRTLATLHTRRTPGVARPDRHGNWLEPGAVLDAFVAERRGQLADLLTAGLTEAETARIAETIGASPDIPSPADPVLCHGDLHPGHVFVDDRLEVSGVIDWGLWRGGSAVDDLSTMFIQYPPEDFATVLAGHGHRDDAEFRHRLALATVNQMIGHLAWSVSIGNTRGTAHGAAVLRTALGQLTGAG